MGVDSREGTKGWHVSANEEKHIVSLGASDALKLRAREGTDLLQVSIASHLTFGEWSS